MIGEDGIGATAATLNVCLNMMDWFMRANTQNAPILEYIL